MNWYIFAAGLVLLVSGVLNAMFGRSNGSKLQIALGVFLLIGGLLVMVGVGLVAINVIGLMALPTLSLL